MIFLNLYLYDILFTTNFSLTGYNLILNNNKKSQIAYGGYLYSIQKECNTMIRWRCTKSNSPTLLSIEHNRVHEVNENMVSAANAKYPTTHLVKFFQVTYYVPESVLAELSKEKYLKRTIRNHRGYKNPPKPRCLSEIIVEARYMSKSKISNIQILIYPMYYSNTFQIVIVLCHIIDLPFNKINTPNYADYG
ncbi:FLYWCH-type domain-containing protein [Aphis craccivora]|uniref:FLYWCH-type domain-containing protein n=1 Tax=Aphis craccivora TaxID=307492 RepID=A0A6G0VNB6_APHCR|nr:FLYWCH-type domain-containing protein [Aphis craccivora]